MTIMQHATANFIKIYPETLRVMRQRLNSLPARLVRDKSDSDFWKFQAWCNNCYEEIRNIPLFSILSREVSKKI